MNIIDIAIIVIIGISILYGLHRGFISSVLGIAAVIVSIGAALMFSGQVADQLKQNETLVSTLTYYTDASSRIKNNDLSGITTNNVNPTTLQNILNQTNLPESFKSVFMEKATNAANTQTLSQVLSRTIVEVSISIISFLVTFLIAFVIATFLVHMITYVFELPVLRHMDALVGGIFGGVRGILIVFILFSLVPLVMAVIPIDEVTTMISESKLAPMFDSKIIFMILRRV